MAVGACFSLNLPVESAGPVGLGAHTPEPAVAALYAEVGEVPWVRFEDSFGNHPKIVGLSDRAFRVFVLGICYSNLHLTDGRLTPAVQRELRCTADVRKELITAGLWHLLDEGLVRIHDYEQYQPTRQHVEALRKERARAGSIGGKRSGEVRRLRVVEGNGKQT